MSKALQYIVTLDTEIGDLFDLIQRWDFDSEIRTENEVWHLFLKGVIQGLVGWYRWKAGDPYLFTPVAYDIVYHDLRDALRERHEEYVLQHGDDE